MEKRLPKWTVRMARLYAFSVTWIAGIAAALSPAAQHAAEAQVIPTAEGAGTTVTETGSQFDIAGGTQAGGNLFHEFDEFSINASQTANFTSDSGVFNIVGQVSSANPSYIDGTVQVSGSDANLYLVNPSGVLFGPDAQVSLSGSFAATTADQLEFNGAVLNVLDNGTDYSSFTGGPSAFHFTETSASAVVNQGDVTVAPGESISLIGGNVVNTGTLSAPGGEISLVAVGGESTVRYGVPGSLLSLEMTAGTVTTGTDFAVTDLPDLLTGSSTPLVDKLTLQPDGSYELGSLQIGDKEVSVAGEISTRATVGDGGEIALLGRSVDAVDAVIDASGDNGGNIRIGRDVGSGSLPTADLVWLHPTSVVRADGLEGAGGDIAVGGTRRARVQGDISAQGTTLGGLVETSSPNLNSINLRVDASGQAENGRWLVTSGDIDIVNDAIDFNQINPKLIESTLDSGTDIEITTTVVSGDSGDISLSDSIVQNGGGNANLTLTGRRFDSSGSTIDLSSEGQLTFGINQVNAEATPDSSSIESAIAAIGNVNGDRLVRLGAGNYGFTNRLNLDTDVEIAGAGADNTLLTTLLAGENIFHIDPDVQVTLRDATFTTAGLGVNEMGGGLVNRGTLSIDSSRFVDNRAFQNGGAIDSFNGGPLIVSNSEFRDNQSAVNGAGGAIYIWGASGINQISNTLFENNTSPNNGGAIRVANATLLVDNGSRFVNNVAGSGGAGIAARSSVVNVTDTVFERNEAAHDGGGISLLYNSIGTVTNSSFTRNQAGDDGGGIYLSQNSDAIVDTVQITANTALDGGGGLYASFGSSIIATDVAIEANVARVGGGLRASDSVVTVASREVPEGVTVSGRFSRNQARELPATQVLGNGVASTIAAGGAISQAGGSLTLNNVKLSRNESEGDGGALAIDGAATTIVDDDTQFLLNTAEGNGGAIATTSTEALTIDSSFLSQNHAEGNGGAIFEDTAATVRVSNTGLQTNTANTHGGGLSLGGGGEFEFESSSLIDNVAQGDGGAIYLHGNGLVSIEFVSISDNEAGGSGGAIANTSDSGRFTIANTGLNNNTASEGGAIMTTAESVSTITAAGFVGNEATTGEGGAVFVGGDSGLTFDRVLFDQNNATGQGGAIFTNSSDELVIASTTFDRNTAMGHGGAIAHNATDQILTLQGATFSENVSQRDGGAVFATHGTTTLVNDSQVLANRAEGSGSRGGGLAIVNGGQVMLTDTVVANNETTNRGGGLFVDADGTVTVTGTLTTDADGVATSATTRFVDNQAGRDGGGILAWDEAVLDLNGVLFRGNFSGDDGGGVAVTELSRATITNSNFENNTVAKNGGGLYSNGLFSGSPSDHRIVLENSRFIENEAGEFGGGFYHGINGSAVVRGSLFRGNETTINGGGIQVGSGILTLENSQLLGNQAQFGAGLEVSSGGVVTVTNTAFTENISSFFGGGAHNDASSQLQVSGSTFERNEAVSGGALFNLGKAEIVNSTLSGNLAQNDGGAIRSYGSEAVLNVQNTTVTANEAGIIGGGIADTDSQLIRLKNTIVAGNVSPVAADVSGQFLDEGNNLIGRRDGSTGLINSALVGSAANPIDPRLAALADNGGPTKTHLLLSDSLAIDAGSNVDAPTVDQRGTLRFSGSATDIGAVELSATELPDTPVAEIPPDFLEPTVSTTAFSELDSLLAVRTRYDQDDADVAIQQLEHTFNQSFEDYWDLSAGPELTFSEVQAVLRRAQEEYKVNSAVVYAIFAPEDPVETAVDTILQVAPTAADDDVLNLSVVMPEGELVSYQLPVTRKEVARQVRYFRSAVSDPEDARSYQPLAQQLYQWLLAPLETDLAAQNVQNLMYALDSGLRTAPLTAMRDDDGFSLERYGLSVVPSMGLMQADFPVSVRRSTIAMGVSEFTQEDPLPAVPIELQVVDQFVPVSQTVLNEFTTLDALKSVQALEQPGILHLATHASFDRRSPEESYIHLWNEPLNMREFSQLDWEKSDLEMLILSACSTALGSRNSELGFAGLAAASGVDATVGSLWDVSDVGTLALMSEFYAQLEETDLRFEALRRAQLALLNGDTRIEDGNLITGHGEVDLPDEWNLPDSATLDHPFFWSAFTMVGNPW